MWTNILLTFDYPPNCTAITSGVKSVLITTTVQKQEKTHFIVMLTKCANGTKLKPLLVFKR